MKLLLVKHSNSNHNPHQPSREWALTDEGIQRCEPLAAHIAPYQPRRIFSSDQPKAQHTAQLISQYLGHLPIHTDPRLGEHSRKTNAPYGNLDDFHNRIRRMFAQPDDLIFGDETANEASKRFSEGVEAVVSGALPDENVVIVAHGTVNTLFTAKHNDIDLYEFWAQLKLPSIIELDLPSYTLNRVIADAGVIAGS